MYPTGFNYGLRPVQPKTQEELDMDAAMAASLLETTRSSYGESTSIEHPDAALEAVLEASQLEAEQQKRAAEQAQRDAMARHYHLPRVSPQIPPSTAPTAPPSEAEQVRLAELISQFDQIVLQKQSTQPLPLATLYTTRSPGVAAGTLTVKTPTDEEQMNIAMYHSRNDQAIEEERRKLLQQHEEEVLATVKRNSMKDAYRTFPHQLSSYQSRPPVPMPSIVPSPSASPYPSTQPSLSPRPIYPSAQPSPSVELYPTLPSTIDPEFHEAQLLSLRAKEEEEMLRQREQQELADVLVLSERSSTVPPQPAFRLPSRATAPVQTIVPKPRTFKESLQNVQKISKLRFKHHDIRFNDVGRPYLVLTYISTMHRMIAVEELRGTYKMFGDNKDPEGAGTNELILNVEETEEFLNKF